MSSLRLKTFTNKLQAEIFHVEMRRKGYTVSAVRKEGNVYVVGYQTKGFGLFG